MREKSDAAIYRPDLGAAVLEYIETEATGNVGLQLMPIFETAEASGAYPVIPAEALMTSGNTARAPRSGYNRDDFEYENGTFQTAEHGREELVDDSEAKLLDRRSPGLSGFVATKRAVGHILRSQERRIAAKIFDATTFTAHNVANEWDDASNGTPINDVNDGINAFRLQCGMLPNVLLITFLTFQKLKESDQIVNRLKYTFPGIDINKMTSDQLAAVFNVPKVIVAGAVYNSAGKGKAATIADIWSNEYAALMRVADGMDMTEPCVGRTFLWTEDSPEAAIVEQYREESKRSEVYRVRHNVAETLIQSKDSSGTVVSNIAANCMYLIGNVNTI